MRHFILSAVFCLGLGQLCHATAAYTSSIEVKNGFVILHASVNGRPGRYILDSGAPGLILNKNYHHSDVVDNGSMHGIHGRVNISVIQEWRFQWDDFSAQGDEAYAIDLTYLEKAVDPNIAGLVGIELFSGYHILIDYASQRLQLWSRLPDVFNRMAFVELDVEMQGHVPVVTLNHESKSFKFAFDSGSAAHILDQKVLDQLDADVTFLNLIDVIGADQKVVRTKCIAANGLSTQGISLPPTNFVVTDLSAMKSATGSKIDGILGQPLLEGRIILIDRDRKFLRLSQVLSQDNEVKEPIAVTAYVANE